MEIGRIDKISWIENLLDSNGGKEIWQNSRRVRIKLQFGGMAFFIKCNRKGLREREAWVAIHEQKVEWADFPFTNQKGFYTPDKVWIEDKDGQILASRSNPRRHLTLWGKLWWDDLDLLYFAGYACWNYFLMPYLFLYEEIKIVAMEEWEVSNEKWFKITLIFPEYIATHSPLQTFYFDKNFCLRRQDYDPLVFASWARAAHYCLSHQTFSGVRVPMRRIVVPRKSNGKSKSFPILVWINVFDFVFEK